MGKDEQLPGSNSDRTIERGETYDHAEHGHVEVTGIWRGTQWIDTVYITNAESTIVVRYIPADDGDWTDELAESLDEFLTAIT